MHARQGKQVLTPTHGSHLLFAKSAHLVLAGRLLTVANAEFRSLGDGATVLLAEHHRWQGGGPPAPCLSPWCTAVGPLGTWWAREGRRLLRALPHALSSITR